MKINSNQKASIIILILLFISVLLSALQVPVTNYLFFGGKATIDEVNGNIAKTYDLSFYLSVVSTVLFAVCLFIKSCKTVSKILSAFLGLRIVTIICSSFGYIRMINTYKNYPDDITDMFSKLITRYTISVCINIVYIVMFTFLLVDVIKSHKYIKISKIIVAVLFSFVVLSAIIGFINNNFLLALVQCNGVLGSIALVIYYYKIAENKNIKFIENKLVDLKTAFENGTISNQEYSQEKERILRNL